MRRNETFPDPDHPSVKKHYGSLIRSIVFSGDWVRIPWRRSSGNRWFFKIKKGKKERGEEFGGREIESGYHAARAETLDY